MEAWMRTLSLATAVLVALVATSYAVAHGIEGAKTATAVAAQFTATNATVSSRTCTTSDNKTIVVTDGRYTGAATSANGDLAGNITLRARSVINTTDDVGTVNGAFRIDVANGKKTQAAFAAVYSGKALAGLAAGRAHEPNARLLANISAGFDPKTGFTNGKIGGATAGGNAVELGAGGCKPQSPTDERSSAKGTISTLTSTSITVAGLTCTVPADKSAEITSKFKQGDKVEIQCALVSGTNTLTRIGKHD
jgi:hypothetical protein